MESQGLGSVGEGGTVEGEGEHGNIDKAALSPEEPEKKEVIFLMLLRFAATTLFCLKVCLSVKLQVTRSQLNEVVLSYNIH